MNPSVTEQFIATEIERDPARARAEYDAEFRSDIEGFVTNEVVEACVAPGIWERRALPNVRYTAFADPSGGSSDAMTIAIAHMDDGIAVLDCIREVKAPFAPDLVVKEFAALLRSYGLSKVVGDRYAASWVSERFRVHGITYEAATRSKSELYVAFLPGLNSRAVSLLDSQRLINQLTSLERRTARGSGRDMVDHPPNAHDDLANAVAGVIANIMDRPIREAQIGIIEYSGRVTPIDPLTHRPLPPRALTAAEGMAIMRPYFR